MRKVLVKICDERRKEFCVKTTIWQDKNEKKVSKEAVFPEGKVLLERMACAQADMKMIYDQANICPVFWDGHALWSQFINGQSMEMLFMKAVEMDDKNAFWKLLEQYFEIMVGNPNNFVDFYVTEEYEDIFGSGEVFVGHKGLNKSNYDVIPGNIIISKTGPVIFDYEWMLNFPVPIEVLKYHALKELYTHLNELELFWHFDELFERCEFLVHRDELEVAYWNFLKYISGSGKTECFADMKRNCLQDLKSFENYKELNEVNYLELLKSLEANIQIEKAWKEASQANAMMNQEIQNIKMEVEYQKKEVEREKENHRIHAKQIEEAVMEQARQSESWRIAYETVVNSRTWRISNKIKRLLGRA